MYGSCAISKQRHFNGSTVLNVVEAIVTDVKTYGQELLDGDRHYDVVILCDSLDMNVERKCGFRLVKSNVSLTVLVIKSLYVHRKSVSAVLKHNACRNVCSVQTVFALNGYALGKLIILVRNDRNRRKVVTGDHVLGPFGIRVVFVAKAILFVAELSCNQANRKAIAD